MEGKNNDVLMCQGRRSYCSEKADRGRVPMEIGVWGCSETKQSDARRGEPIKAWHKVRTR